MVRCFRVSDGIDVVKFCLVWVMFAVNMDEDKPIMKEQEQNVNTLILTTL